MAFRQALNHWLGVELDAVSGKEKFISALGGMLSILLVATISRDALHLTGAAMLIASMGASAVLLFAVPHGQLSQPWPVIAGQGISALLGVACARHLPHTPLAAGCAVGLAIGAMHLCKCIHPPGGATALTAVIGGPEIADLGYSFVWCPVLANALIMVTVAVLFNYAFRWRRYPAFLNRPTRPVATGDRISHAAVVGALRRLDSFVDITEDDLLRLHQLLNEVEQRRQTRRPAGEGRPEPLIPR